MTALDKLSRMTPISYEGTSKKNYSEVVQWRNTTSHSMRETLHQCARKFQLIKSRAASGGGSLENVHLSFGHSVGAGIQAYMASGDLGAAIFNGFMAWTIDYNAVIERKRKSIWQATLAIEKFVDFREKELSDWKIWTLPNGKPALEVTIEVDFEDGYKHYLHIDAILEHKVTGQLAVMENKTDGWSTLDEAKYANSAQALGYAAAVDMLSDYTSFDVFYCVYSTTAYEWQLLPFSKSTSLKAEWILDVSLDHATLSTYHQLKFYPKRGESCFDFARRCEFFGVCNLTSNLPTPADLPRTESAERIDFSFTVTQLRERQHERILDPANKIVLQPTVARLGKSDDGEPGVEIESID